MDIIEMENAVKKAKLNHEKLAKMTRKAELERQILETEFTKAKIKLELDRVEMSILELEEALHG